MRRFSLIVLFLFMPILAHAGLVERYFDYGPTSTVTNINLNGNFDNIVNELNGGLTGDNADSANGWRFIEILPSSPAAGNQGRVVFLTSNNTLNFDTGSTFLQTAVLQNVQTFTAANTFNDNVTVAGTTTLNGNTALNGTTNTIGNGGSDTFSINALGINTWATGATTWTLSGALTVSGTIADLGTVTTADINGGTMDNVQIGGTTATGELIVNDASDDADGLGSQGTTGQFLMSNGTGANPSFNGSSRLLSTTTFSSASTSGDITITAGKKYFIFVTITSVSIDQNIYMLFNTGDTTTYAWVYDQQLFSTSPTSTLTGDDSDTEIDLGGVNGGDGYEGYIIFDNTAASSGAEIWIGGKFGGTDANPPNKITRDVAGLYDTDGSAPTNFRIIPSTGTFTGQIDVYEY